MKKILFLVVGVVLGFVAGAGTVLFYYPFWFPPAEVNEIITQTDTKSQIGSGRFIHPDPDDSVHWGKGSLEVYRDGLMTEFLLAADFEVGPGPDFHIYLINRQNITDKSQFDPADALELGRLKSFKGSQVYQTNEANALENHSIVVWCKAFKQLITTANIE